MTADATALYEYTAPDSTTLASATQYWIVVEHNGDDVRFNTTDPAATLEASLGVVNCAANRDIGFTVVV